MIKRLKELRDASIKYEEPADMTSWNSQLGILISRNDLDKLIAVCEAAERYVRWGEGSSAGHDGLMKALAALEEE